MPTDLLQPPDPARVAIVDPKTGMLTPLGFYFLLGLFKAAVRAEGTALLEAIDSGSEITVIPGLQDFAAKVAALAEGTPGITQAQLEEVQKLFVLTDVGLSPKQIEEVRILAALEGGACNCAQTISNLEKFVAMDAFAAPPAAPAAALVTNSGAGGGQALNPDGTSPGTPLAPGTPAVSALPGPSDPLSVPGQYVLFNGVPYLFRTDPSAGPTGFWSLDTTGSPTIRDVFANLHLYSAASYPVGTIFFATDWLVSYAVQNPAGGKAWLYYNGIYEAPIASLPGTLGVNDIYFTFRASDYLHSWKWNGAAWHFTTGGTLAGSEAFSVTGPPFGGFGTLWHLEDGTTQPISQDDGTLHNTLLPTRANYYIAQ